jgi:hypothetical protein
MGMIPWVTSAATLLAVWLNGRNVRLSWKVSLLNQAIWLVFIVTYDAWGLLPLTLALSAIFARHLRRTRRRPDPGWLSDQKTRDDGRPISTATTLRATSGDHKARTLDRSRVARVPLHTLSRQPAATTAPVPPWFGVMGRRCTVESVQPRIQS